MAKKFDLFNALLEAGFKKTDDIMDKYGNICLAKSDFTKTQGWLQGIAVKARFSQDRNTVTVSYYYDVNFRREFKHKTHFSDKRAYNAIIATINFQGYEF